jgi:hypothetical protein
MKKLTLIALVAILLSAFNSCRNGQETDHTATAAVNLNPNDSLFVINEGGYTFEIIMPKDIMIANTPSIQLNSATGDLHIQCGDQFWIIASLEKTDVATIKTQLNEDMLFTSKIVEETNNSLLYQRTLPDGAEYDYNYRSICELGGKAITFRTSEEGEFSLESVNRMKSAISTVRQSV